MKSLQMFIHRHSETIKLILIIVIGVLSFYILFNQLHQNNQASIQREETVAELLKADQEVVRAIQDEVEAQTVIMNRQFRALCIIIIETSGQEGLKKLDDNSRQQCERLADNPQLTEQSAVEQQQNLEQGNPPDQDNQNNESSPQTTPSKPENQSDSSQNDSHETPEPDNPTPEPEPLEDERNMLQRIIDNVSELVRSIL